MKNVDIDEPTHFLTTCTWDALNVHANQMKPSLDSTQRCLSHISLLEQQKIYRDGRNLMRTQLRGPTTWRDMLRNFLSDTVN